MQQWQNGELYSFPIFVLPFNSKNTGMLRLLIIGANGVLGKVAANYFLQKGYKVKALVRDKGKAAELEKAGATVVAGDLTEPATIKEVCNETDVIITAAHGMIGKGKNSSQRVDDAGHRNLIDIARKAGVKQFIYTSIHGASADHPVDFFRTKYRIEQYLQQSGMNFTILHLPAFMEWHIHKLLGESILKKGKTVILGKGKNPANFIAVNDIVQAMNEIIGNEKYYNRCVNIAGPENISRNQIAQLYGRHLGITPKVTHLPVAMLKVLSVVIKPFHPGIARIMKLSAFNDKADTTMNTNESICQWGLKPITPEEFISKMVGK